jgi:predicted ArsR family transcriptional regulator
MVSRPLPDRVAALAALDDPVRRAVFDLVARAGTAVSRDQAAEALGVSRRIAASHLDRLAGQGLLAVEYRRPPGRGGPGAGRPAKLYRRTEDEVAVSVPERHYDLVGGLLAAAVTESIDTGTPVQEVLHRTAYDDGRAIGAAAGNLLAALEDAGYEPRQEGQDSGAVVLGNCPFHRLAQQFTALVCGVNLQLLRGVADGAGDSCCLAELDPGPGRCCVRLRPAAQGHGT